MTVRFYLDTEFDDATMMLISIGVVAHARGSVVGMFYAINTDANYGRLDSWIVDNVLPKLSDPYVDTLHAPPCEIANKLAEFVDKHAIDRDALTIDDIEFWAYFAATDWVMLYRLFGTMMNLPSGWPRHCLDIKQLAKSVWISSNELNRCVPKDPAKEHCAIHDALRYLKMHAYIARKTGRWI
jgi:hypothetical protein